MENLIKKGLSPIRYGSGSFQRGWKRRAARAPFTIVLAYHHVVDDEESASGRFDIERGVSAKRFEAHLHFMLKYFAPVEASRALEYSTDRLRFAVTLDDGYEDNYRVAAPILHRLGIPATFFVVSDYVGTDRLFWWEQLANMIRETKLELLDYRTAVPGLQATDDRGAPMALRSGADREAAYETLAARLRAGPPGELRQQMHRLSNALGVSLRDEGREYGLMSWSQLRELAAQGFEIGGHTMTHINLIGASGEDAASEIEASMIEIGQRIGAAVLAFAYPYGLYDSGDNPVSGALRAAGCRVAFTGKKGVVEEGLDAFELPRAIFNRPFEFAWAYNVDEALARSRQR